MSRLIREIDVQRILTKTELSGGNIVEAKIAARDIETAYDVEAVARKLEELKGAYERQYEKDRDLRNLGAFVGTRKAIEIVKRGGRNE